MRRLVIEVDAADFASISGDISVAKIESMEVLHFIRQEPEEISLICKVRFKDPATTMEEVFDEPGSDFKVLDVDRRGTYTVLYRGKPDVDIESAKEFWSGGGTMLAPLAIKDGRLSATFLGNARQIVAILKMLRDSGIRYRARQYADASLLPGSPLSSLTEKQREVLRAAFQAGYYDLPRKVGSKQLAAKLKIGSSDLIKHRRKAEKRLLAELLA